MSGLTPEAARAAAEWLETLDPCGYPSAAYVMRREADRLENASKTPGQVLAEASGCYWADLDQYATDMYADRAAAVIAHHVGADRIVVDKYLVEQAWETIDNAGRSVLADNLREALS